MSNREGDYRDPDYPKTAIHGDMSGRGLQSYDDLFGETEKVYPNVVNLSRHSSTLTRMQTPRIDGIYIHPEAFEWLKINVPFDDWQYDAHFSDVWVFFKDKKVAALFKLMFSHLLHEDPLR